jgi:hypothetical protein
MGLFWDKLKAVFKKNSYVEMAEEPLYKKSKAPAVLVAVGFGKEYDNNLAIRKSKSQRRNWSRWKNK